MQNIGLIVPSENYDTCLNPRTFKLTWVFVVVQHFEKFLPLMGSLWRALQDEVIIMRCGTAGGPWRHPKRRPRCTPSWILLKIRNYQKAAEIEIFYARHEKYDISISLILSTFCAFSSKHFLLMMSYLLTIATDPRQTIIKMCLRDITAAPKT